MAFVSKNEIEQFSFEDCQISSVEKTENDIIFYLEALMVRERNSQNTNYTLSYADTTKAILSNAKIYSVVLAGYKVFDANDNLVENVEDKIVAKEEWDNVFSNLKNAYLYRMISITDEEKAGLEDAKAFVYDIEVEAFEDPDIQDLREDAYTLRIGFDKSTFSWNRYLNRVQ